MSGPASATLGSTQPPHGSRRAATSRRTRLARSTHVGTNFIAPDRPYTKSVVQALELRIHTLEAQLAAALASNSQSTNHRSSSSSDDAKLHSPLTASPSKVGISAMASGSGIGPHPLPRPAPGLDAFQGGLALNAHGELRFYVRSFSSFLALVFS